jgi:transposase
VAKKHRFIVWYRQLERVKLAAESPRVEVVRDVPASEKVCTCDGTPLRRIGEVASEQLGYQRRRFPVIRNIRRGAPVRAARPALRRSRQRAILGRLFV